MDVCINNLIFIKEGLWRKNNISDSIHECITKKSCLGGKGNFTCAKGYIGAICG